MLTRQLCAVVAAAGWAAALPRAVQRAKILARQEDINDSYDYVVIGGGTAGLTVADRLTENENVTVLVIEYGVDSDSPKITTVQGGFNGVDGQFMFPTTSVPQVNLRNRATAVLAGRVLGGSSAINALMGIRGSRGDYNRWGSFFSNESIWSWEGILPYFKKALTYVPPNPDVAESAGIIYDTSYWGNTSDVFISWPSFQYESTVVQVEAWKEMPGVEFTPDSGSGLTGVYWYPQYMDPETAERSYAKTGHYANRQRDNYHVITESRVNKILLDGTRATGVAFKPASDASAEAKTVKATREVILSAGAVHSPQIMELSGLGQKAVVEAAGIESVVDIPGVGANFQDHPMLTARYTLRNFNYHPSPGDLTADRDFRAWAQEAWQTNRTGPYSIATGNFAAWLSFPVISERYEEIATMLEEQDHAAQLPEGTDPTVAAGYRAQMLSYAEALRSNHTAFYNMAFTGMNSNGILVDLHPLSRGTIHVNPRNPEGEPVVDYRALSNSIDAKIMADIHRYTRKFYLDNPVNAKWSPQEVQPNSRIVTDEDMAAYLAQTLSPTEYHPAGTCAMMPLELGGVVNEELRVYGVERLRIVDASIMPTLPGGNTCQSVYALAEKAADIIKATVPEDVPVE